ncbi:MAG TPA: 5'-3' exonuclease H3TH domain-containing protein, partial [Stellaceae bacterium]|nr:5'-3' exonuclease H3TH domain-containing protein [Stellaceae bacterium]
MSKTRHVYLIDGSGYIFRAYHALPPLTRADGTPVGAVLGFSNILYKFLQDTEADHLAVVFDSARTTFRNRIYDQYKAHRPDPPDDLIPQFKLVRDATDAFNVCRIEREDFEADDLIATYAREAEKAGATVTIVSSDKDLMQLISDRISMWDPIKQKPIGAAEVKEKFGVGPEKVVEVQALIGDSVDNVPGVPGIGPKTAAELIGVYGTLESVLEHASEIKQPKRRQALIDHAENARMSKKLVQLDDKVPLTVGLDDLTVKPLDRGKITHFLREQGFRTLLNRVESKLGNAVAGTVEAAPMPAAEKVEGAEAPAAPAPSAKLDPSVPVEKRYELVQDSATLDRWIAAAHAQGFVAVSAETTTYDHAKADLVGVALALAPGHAAYVPLGHYIAEGPDALALAAQTKGMKQIPLREALAKLKPLLEDPGVLKIGHDIKFDAAVFAGHDIVMAPVDATLLISFVLDAGRHGHDLDELVPLHFGGQEIVAYKDVAGTG